MPFGLQPLDLLVIVVVALVIFGPKRLPQIGRWLGKAFSSFRKGAHDLADGFAGETRAQDRGSDTTTPAAAEKTDKPPNSPEEGAAAGDSQNVSARCSACGATNPPDARFCCRCGARLTT